MQIQLAMNLQEVFLKVFSLIVKITIEKGNLSSLMHGVDWNGKQDLTGWYIQHF
jgi:hypothetical protein